MSFTFYILYGLFQLLADERYDCNDGLKLTKSFFTPPTLLFSTQLPPLHHQLRSRRLQLD